MSVIVKIMSDQNLADDDSRKSHILVTGVASVEFLRHPAALVCLNFNDGREGYSIPANGNVYVMNEAGKTVSSFNPGAVDIPGLVYVLLNGENKLIEAHEGPYDVSEVYKLLAVPSNYLLLSVDPVAGAVEVPRDTTAKVWLGPNAKFAWSLDPRAERRSPM